MRVLIVTSKAAHCRTHNIHITCVTLFGYPPKSYCHNLNLLRYFYCVWCFYFYFFFLYICSNISKLNPIFNVCFSYLERKKVFEWFSIDWNPINVVFFFRFWFTIYLFIYLFFCYVLKGFLILSYLYSVWTFF